MMTFEQWWEINGVGYSSYEEFARDVWEAAQKSLLEEQAKGSIV